MPSRRSIPQRVSDSFRVIKELDLSHVYERQAGSVTLLVLALAVGGAVVGGWLAWGRGRVTVVAEFDGARGLVGGDPVVVAGVSVGRVRRVELVEPGRVRVTMVVERGRRPRRDASLAIVSLNLIGDVAVSYDPGGDTVYLSDGQLLAGRAPASLDAELVGLRERAEDAALASRAFLRPDFAADVADARAATTRAQAALASAGAAPAAALAEALAAGQAALRSLDSLVSRVPVDSTRVRLDELGTNAGELMAGVGAFQERLAAVQQRMARGEGNVGLATRDSALRVALAATRRSLDHLLLKYLGRRPASRDTAR